MKVTSGWSRVGGRGLRLAICLREKSVCMELVEGKNFRMESLKKADDDFFFRRIGTYIHTYMLRR